MDQLRAPTSENKPFGTIFVINCSKKCIVATLAKKTTKSFLLPDAKFFG